MTSNTTGAYISKEIAGVNMCLKPGGIRELHCQVEWAWKSLYQCSRRMLDGMNNNSWIWCKIQVFSCYILYTTNMLG